MKAIVFEEFGPPEVLHLSEVEKPAPGEGEVRIKIHAATVTKYDTWVRSNTTPPGFGLIMRLASSREPKQQVLGTELAGEIDAIGSEITQFKVGDQVFGFSEELGTYAETICLPESAVAHKPPNLSYAEAACVPEGALTALYFLRKANIQPGQKVLVFGASGGVGNYAVQLAKNHFGAEVTGVCSTRKMAFVKQLGVDHVIDYTREDFTQNGQVYDVIFDTVGKTSITRTRKSLAKKGSYIFATFSLPALLQMLWFSTLSSQKFIYGLLDEQQEDLIFLKDLIEAGKITPIIDRTYPLEQAAEAHRYVESGKKVGNVVLIVAKNNS